MMIPIVQIFTKDYPFVGLKWETTPCLPQEPHYFNSGSSQVEYAVIPPCKTDNKIDKHGNQE